MIEKIENIEKRILEIISFINKESLVPVMKNSSKFFSQKELKELLVFLESGDYKFLYELLEEKIEQYKENLEKIKLLNIKVKGEKKQKDEKKEREQEKKEAEILLNF